MAQCPLEIPQCKRKLMTTDEPFKKKQCPLNVKPQCCLVPPACPLVPQQDSVCGLSKLAGKGEPLDVSQCPAKSPCMLAPAGCPLSPNTPNNTQPEKDDRQFPDYMPQCPLEDCAKIKKKTESSEDVNSNKQTSGIPKSYNAKRLQTDGNKCPISSTARPLPCAECILEDLSSNASGDGKNVKNVKTCPFLRIADMCGPLCKCVEVPEIDAGPRCPFLPKPCPCCTTPRCPLTKEPDCPLKPKPLCMAKSPPCYCGKNCLGETIQELSCPPIPPNPPRCLCGGCPLGPPCPLKAPKCICGRCPLLFPCCPPKPCKCVCGMCPIGKILCTVASKCTSTPLCPLNPPSCPLSPPSCPLNPPSCPLSPPSCPLNPPSCPLSTPSCPLNPPSCPLSPPSCPLNPPSCPLSQPSCPLDPTSCPINTPSCPLNPPPCPLKDPCPLLKKPICPPIPPPCSLNKYELQLDPPKSTFHVPICPQYKPPCEKHLIGDSDLICPFSPHPCPLGDTCPFPINNPRKANLKGQSNPKTPLNTTKTSNKTPNIKTNDLEGCPGSTSCGIMPHPECPAAEILFPEKYKKKVKPKKEPCPLKVCMRKPECPLNRAMPKIECPLKEDSDCPLSKEPDCPIVELANKCPIANACPGLEQVKCPLENKHKNPEVKNVKSEGQGCPLSNLPECLKGSFTQKPNCPLLPKIDCPLAPKPDCPLAPIPGCPLKEFAPKSECPVASISCPLTSSLNCPLATSTKIPKQPMTKKTNTEKSQCVLSKLTQDGGNKKCGSTQLDGTNAKNDIVLKLKKQDIDCPLVDLVPKQNCPLAPPPCPLTPKPKCALTKKPDPCPLSLQKPFCPVEYPPCKKFPDGRCPMGSLNICDCEYPVSPCFYPLQEDVIAPPQYCYRENCCMGLGLPPIEKLSTDSMTQADNGYYYKFMDTKPGKEETKHYVQVMTERPNIEVGLIGKKRERLHNNWSIIKHGEGFKRCKTVTQKLLKLGSIENKSAQYFSEDCELGPDGIAILEFKNKRNRELAKIELIKKNLSL